VIATDLGLSSVAARHCEQHVGRRPAASRNRGKAPRPVVRRATGFASATQAASPLSAACPALLFARVCHNRAACPHRIESRGQRLAVTATIERPADTNRRKRVSGDCNRGLRRRPRVLALAPICDRSDRPISTRQSAELEPTKPDTEHRSTTLRLRGRASGTPHCDQAATAPTTPRLASAQDENRRPALSPPSTALRHHCDHVRGRGRHCRIWCKAAVGAGQLVAPRPLAQGTRGAPTPVFGTKLLATPNSRISSVARASGSLPVLAGTRRLRRRLRSEARNKPALPGWLHGTRVVVLANVGNRVGGREAVEDRDARQRGSRAASAAAAGDRNSLRCSALPHLNQGVTCVVAIGRKPPIGPADPARWPVWPVPVRDVTDWMKLGVRPSSLLLRSIAGPKWKPGTSSPGSRM
jgi:hypothetical protein